MRSKWTRVAIRQIVTGNVDFGDEVLHFDWAERLALSGFHADHWEWLRNLSPWRHNPVPVTRRRPLSDPEVQARLRELGFDVD